MDNHLRLSDSAFKNSFEDTSLSPDLFNHEAHLRLAWLHINNSGIESAKKIVSEQIFNFVKKLEAQDKFNLTLTMAAVEVVNHFYNKSTSNNFVDFINEFPRLKTNFKDLISTHYGFDIYNFEKAKLQYLEPDLLPFC